MVSTFTGTVRWLQLEEGEEIGGRWCKRVSLMRADVKMKMEANPLSDGCVELKNLLYHN